MWYYVYVLYQPNRDSYYLGMTNNLKRRLTEHKRNKVFSTRSSKKKPILVFVECFKNKRDAERRERYLKTTKGKRTLKILLKSFRGKFN